MAKLRKSWRENLQESRDMPKKEGHTIEPVKNGKPKRVKDWEKKLMEV